MATMRTLTGTIANLIHETPQPNTVRVVIDNNLNGGALIDSANQTVMVGGVGFKLEDGAFSVQLPDTAATDLNVEPNTLRYTVRISYVNGDRERKEVSLGPFELTANRDLSDPALDLDLPVITAEWRSAYKTEVETLGAAKVAQAEAARTAAETARAFVEARVVDDLGTTDGQTKALIETPSSETAQALAATIAAEFEANAEPVVGALVPPLVAAAIADDDTVVAAAAAAAGPAVDAELDTSPRIPQSYDVPTYKELAQDPNGRAAYGVRDNGALDAHRLGHGVGPTLEAETEVASAGGIRRAGIDSVGHRDESEIGPDGRTPMWVLRAQAARLAAGGDGLAKRCHLIVGTGQSNSIQSDTTIPVRLPDSRVYRFDGTTLAVAPTTEVTLISEAARAYAATIPSDEVVVYVSCGVGATGFTSTSINPPPAGYVYYPTAGPGAGTWDRLLTSDPHNHYLQAVTKVNAAKAAVAAKGWTLVPVAVIFGGGEQDTPTLDQAAYAAKWDDFRTNFSTATGLTGAPFVLYSPVPEDTDLNRNAHTLDVNRALAATPARVPTTAFVYGPRGHAKPGEVIHYSTAGQVERGGLFPDALLRARANRTDIKPDPPQQLRLTRYGDELTATWTPPLPRAVAYMVEVSTDDGGSWTALTVNTLNYLEATGTVPAGTPALVRARCSNEVTTSEYTYAKG